MKVFQGIGVALGVTIASMTVGFAQTGSADPTSWSTHTSPEGQFSVQLPAEPSTNSVVIPLENGETTWTVTRSDGVGGTYTVAYSDLSADAIDAGQGAFIEGIQERLITEYEWEPINFDGTPIEVDGFPGREFIGTRDSEISVLRLYLADQRLYSVIGVSRSLDSLNQFLSSFNIDTWQPYTFEAHGFSISLPEEPNEDSLTTRHIEGRELDWTILEARNFAFPGELYTVSYADLDSQLDPSQVLSRVGAAIQEELPLSWIDGEGTPVSLGDRPGLSFLASNDDGELFAFNLYLVDQRLYGIGAKSGSLSHITQFINSLQIQ